ncbi:MAG: hypothetical protein MZW92_50700 [Comamonadaceae bacterium]|nr:hypothetical protein [Comamonadaceae bacterium]
MAARRGLKADDVTWFPPHYSSEYFRPRLAEAMARCGFAIPQERWFSNLTRTGNVGSAAIYLILEELFYSGKLKTGDRLLCYVPESARWPRSPGSSSPWLNAMKTHEVPQEESMLEGHQRACYAIDEHGRYVVVGSIGWQVEKVVNAQANDEVRAGIAAALRRARAGTGEPARLPHGAPPDGRGDAG